MEPTNTAEYTLEEVIESMFDLSDYSAEEKESVIDETISMITEAALMRGLADASESVQDDFNDLLETEPTEEKLMEFIKKNIPNFEKLVAEEISIFDAMGDSEEK